MRKPNKKVKNATPNEYNGIQFKSQLERMTYKTLVEAGFNPVYEGFSYILSDKQTTKTPYYSRTPKKGFHLNGSIVPKISYTPDFVIRIGELTVIIEAKGRENDIYPVKRNLFRKYLDTLPGEYMFFEVRSKIDVINSIIQINNKTNENTL